ncbi:hypothetical protein ACFQ07_00570 [Actinomadura adrarensis]|uniref:PH domain-containing protein n=1 Tax=Actinomadura adrarensis TaxID=1819600 RepID=A0ABW3CB40_9ACTN
METGTRGQVIRRYRLRPGQLVFITLLLGWEGVPLAVAVVPDDDLSVTFKAGLIALISLVYLALIAFWRAATIVHRDHIAVRLLRTRRTAWSDVLSIEIDPASPRTMLLDREGHLFALKGGVGAGAEEVRAIRDTWERSRGEDWTPPAEAFVLAAQLRARARTFAFVWAFLLTVGSFLVLLLSGFVIGSGMESDELPWPFEAIGFVPLVVFPAAYQVALRILHHQRPTPAP